MANKKPAIIALGCIVLALGLILLAMHAMAPAQVTTGPPIDIPMTVPTQAEQNNTTPDVLIVIPLQVPITVPEVVVSPPAAVVQNTTVVAPVQIVQNETAVPVPVVVVVPPVVAPVDEGCSYGQNPGTPPGGWAHPGDNDTDCDPTPC